MKAQHRLGLSLVLALAPACSGSVEMLDGGADAQVVTDSGTAMDAGEADAGEADAGANPDATVMDVGGMDAGRPDTGPADAGQPDASSPDTGPIDAGSTDSGEFDAGAPDAGTPDTGTLDTGTPDTGTPDASPPDAGTPDAGTPDTGTLDAGTPDTGTLDAGGMLGCDVVVPLPEVAAGQVGGNGGSVGPNLACPAGAEVIGVALRVSDQNTANGVPSAVGIALACAAVQLDSNGVATVGPETLPEVAGTGQFGWSPATLSTITRCPPGWIVSGLTASTGANANILVDASVECSELLTNGATSGVTQTFAVMGSGTGSGVSNVATCAAGQAVRRMTTRVGAGLDAVTLLCGTPGCAAP